MTRGSRSNLLRAAGELLQANYARSRSAARSRFEVLRDAGAFRAPVHLVAPLQASLGLPEPLLLDQAMAEAA